MALAPQSETAMSDTDSQPLTGMERRMNIRAFDYWESLLNDRDFPSVGDLDPDAIAPFREHSLLIDFTNGYEAPVLRYVGSHLRAEASLANREIDPNDVPSGTLLSRLTNHYLEILANRAPIGFEAEYNSSNAERIKYRGILMPLSDDGTTINFVYGVISWKVEDILPGEDVQTQFDDDVLDLDAPVDPDDSELLELTQALDDAETNALLNTVEPAEDEEDAELRSLVSEIDAAMGIAPEEAADASTGEQDTGEQETGDAEDTADQSAGDSQGEDGAAFDDGDLMDLTDEMADLGDLEDPVEAAAPQQDAGEVSEELDALEAAEIDLVESVPIAADMEMGAAPEEREPLASPASSTSSDDELFEMLAQCQSAAADLARFDSRSRAALYETLSLGYDFHLVSQRKQAAYQDLLEKTGITMQSRAPVTPIIKLIFGQGYDKTRVTEYAAALGYADREGVPQGEFQRFVESFEGGIKAMVKAERAARNFGRGNEAIDRLEAAKTVLRERPALMTVDQGALHTAVDDEDEFVLMVARRDANGGFAVLDAVKAGKTTLEAALKKAAQSKDKKI